MRRRGRGARSVRSVAQELESDGKQMMETLHLIHPSDNVAVALRDLNAGEMVDGLTVLQLVPAGHKIALRRIEKGARVMKYGMPIGEATEAIPAGAWVHTHNLRSLLTGAHEYRYEPDYEPTVCGGEDTFSGFLRQDGRAGTRNELWIVPTVGCVSGVARELEARAQAHVFGPVEGVHAFNHPYGCSQAGDDEENTQRILAALATHPNAGGVLVLGLGCEHSSVAALRARMGEYDRSRVRFLVCQDVANEMETGAELLHELAEHMRGDRRVPVPVSKLIVGLKCGGSDGFSGLTANPVIGGFTDRLIARGGSALLTEVPEMFGAETLLLSRCETRAVFDDAVRMVNGFKDFFAANHRPMYENPTPGNKAGGVTTLEEKSLGCTQKSGRAPVRGVIEYGRCATAQGLSLLTAPGNDLVSSTACVAAGAQLLLFSTGRGTPFGCPVPTLKIATNSQLARRKPGWIDFDAGAALNGATGLSDELYSLALATAGGRHTRNEENGYHQMAIFKSGVTL